MKSARRIAFVLTALVAAGCAPLPMAPVHVGQLDIRPPPVLVARRSPRTLYIVLDPKRVPDAYVIPERELKEVKIFQLQEFVRKSLRSALGSFFEHVEVVPPDFRPPAQPHVVAEVVIDSLGAVVNKVTSADMRTMAGQAFGEIRWSFALRPSETTDFLFSYSGRSVGRYAMVHVSEAPAVYESTFERAIEDMVKAFLDKHMDQAILDLDAGHLDPA